MDKEKLKLLYDGISESFDLGSFDDFMSKMDNPEKRKAFYDGASESFDLGSFDEFESKIGVSSKKKDDTQLDSSLEESSTDSSIQSGDSDLEERVEEAREDSKFMNIVNNIGNTAQNIGNSLSIAQNEFAGWLEEKVSGKQSPITFINRVKGAEYVDENNKQIEANTIARSYDPEKSFEENVEVAQQGIVETFRKDGATAGLGEVGIKVLESSPYLVTSLLTGGTGGAATTAGTFFLTGYGNSIAEQTIESSDPETLNQSRAFLKGIVEGTASIAFGGISKAGKEMFKNVSRQEAKKILGNNMKNQLKRMMGDAGKTSASEGLEESLQELANYTIDTYYDDEEFNPDRALKIATDALILGSASGGIVGGGMNRYKYARAKAQQNDQVSKIDAELELESTKDNPIKESMLKKQKAQLINDIEAKDISDEDANKLDKLYYDVQDLEKVINSTQDADLRDQLNTDLQAKREEFNSILDKYESESSDNQSDQNEQSPELGSGEESEVDLPSGEARVTDESSNITPSEFGLDERGSSQSIVNPDGGSDIDTGEEGGAPRIREEDLKELSESSKVSFDFVDDSKLKESGNTKVSTLDVLGTDGGDISVKRAHAMIKKKVKKYEALINCIG